MAEESLFEPAPISGFVQLSKRSALGGDLHDSVELSQQTLLDETFDDMDFEIASEQDCWLEAVTH